MLDIKTPSEELIKEFNEEYYKALYWFKKQYGGDVKYEKQRDEWLRKCSLTGKDYTTPVVEYKSKKGNRWRIFECCRHFPESGGSHSQPYAFVYYETLGSCGAFIPFAMQGEEGEMSVMVFTSHFFLHMCQRMGITYKSSKMLAGFIEMIPSIIMEPKDRFRFGHREVDVALPGSIGRGLLLKQDFPMVARICCFLKNSQLEKYQLRDTERMRNAQQVIQYEPTDMRVARVIKTFKSKGDDAIDELYDEYIKKHTALGMDKEVLELFTSMNASVAMEMLAQGADEKYFSPINGGDAALARRFNHEGMLNAAYRIVKMHRDWMSPFCETLLSCRVVARNLNVKNFDILKAASDIYNSWNRNRGIESDGLTISLEELNSTLAEYSKKVEAFDKKYAKQ